MGHKRVLGWVTVVAGLAIAPHLAQAHILSVIDGNSTIEVNPHPPTQDQATQTGLFNWLVNGTDQMSQQWFWFRIGDQGPESSLDTLNLLDHEIRGSNLIHLTYAGPLEVNVFYLLMGGPMNGVDGSWLEELVTIRNPGDEPIDLRWFEYTDFDLGGTPGGDSAVFSSPDLIGQIDPDRLTLSLVQSRSPAPTHWEIGEFPSILTRLNDVFPTTLADGTSPLGPADLAQAFQYNFDALAPGAVVRIAKIKDILLVPIPPVIPEPGTWILLGTGLMGLAGWRRRGLKKSA